jgi:hypothetical protein
VTRENRSARILNVYNLLKSGLNNFHIVVIVPHKGQLSGIAEFGSLVYQIAKSDALFAILEFSSFSVDDNNTKRFRTERYSVSWR